MTEEKDGKPVIEGGEIVPLSSEEKQVILNQRVMKEKQEACAKEIQEVLSKHGFAMQVMSQPQITLVPRVNP